MSPPPPGRPAPRLRATALAAATARALLAHPLTFCGVALVVYAPHLALSAAVAAAPPAADPALYGAWRVIDRFYALLVAPLAAAAVIHGVLELAHGRPPRVGAGLRVAARRGPAVIGVGLATLVLMVFVAILMTLPLAMWLGSFTTSPAALTAGYLAVGAALVAVMTTLWLAAPAAVAERATVADALTRSAALTRGALRPIFTLLMLLYGGKLALEVAHLHDPHGPPGDDAPMMVLATAALGVVVTLLSSVGSAVAYVELRRAREGDAALEAVFE